MYVYAPISTHMDEGEKDIYDDITFALNDVNTHFRIICGYFNVKVG